MNPLAKYILGSSSHRWLWLRTLPQVLYIIARLLISVMQDIRELLIYPQTPHISLVCDMRCPLQATFGGKHHNVHRSCKGLSSINPFPSHALSKRVQTLTPSEDCLFLTVYVPGQLSQKKTLPVVIWIHGGGWSVGSASTYNGDDLISDANGGVIVVAIQYRLVDQNFAFRWVQEHIAKFGGDPTRVTLWGESGGAGSVLQHIVAQDGKSWPPLFKAAIGSSATLTSQYHYNDPIPESIYSAAVVVTNCSTATSSLACMRSADISVLQATNLQIARSAFFGQYTFVPVVDGSFITRRPTEVLKEGKVNGDTLLAVTNTLEGSIFLDPKSAPTVQVSNFIQQLLPELGQRGVNAAVAEYKDLGSPFEQVTAIIGEYTLYCPTHYLLRPFRGRSYKATFAIAPGEHGDDIPYYFPSRSGLRGNAVYNNTTFRKSFAESLLNFAMSHDPNAKTDLNNITPQWEKWTSNGNAEMVFNKTVTDTPDIYLARTSAGLLKRCQFWESVS